jgi:hypothetical protein
MKEGGNKLQIQFDAWEHQLGLSVRIINVVPMCTTRVQPVQLAAIQQIFSAEGSQTHCHFETDPSLQKSNFPSLLQNMKRFCVSFTRNDASIKPVGKHYVQEWHRISSSKQIRQPDIVFRYFI